MKNTLQDSLDYGWTKTKTVEQLRKVARMTVRQARECVKNELGEQRRWEDAEHEKQLKNKTDETEGRWNDGIQEEEEE